MKILCLGDSIMQFNDCTSFPQTGWVQFLDRFFKRGTVILNFARNGRSSKSFIAEGRFDIVLKNCEKGDFALIQFAHNDEKIADKTRFSSPEEGGDFRKNLTFFVENLRSKGVLPILLTPVVRRKFDENGKIVNSHGEYPDAIKQTAQKLNIPCVDLAKKTADFFEKKGAENSKRYFMNFEKGLYSSFIDGKSDDSHLRPEGAFEVSRIFAESLSKVDLNQFGEYKPLIDCLALNGVYTDKDIDDEKLMWK